MTDQETHFSPLSLEGVLRATVTPTQLPTRRPPFENPPASAPPSNPAPLVGSSEPRLADNEKSLIPPSAGDRDGSGSRPRPVKRSSRRLEYAGFAVTLASLLLVMFLLYLYVFS